MQSKKTATIAVKPNHTLPAELVGLLDKINATPEMRQFCQRLATMVSDLRLGPEAILAAGLYRLMEQLLITAKDIHSKEFEAARYIVDGINRLKIMDELTATDDDETPAQTNQLDRLRRMLLAMVEDPRVVIIKFCYRLLELQEAKTLDDAVRRKLARETLDIYTPLANRLGIWQIKWQMEDLCLRYLEPAAYHQVAHWLDGRRVDREEYIRSAIGEIETLLDKYHIKAEVTGRPKHIYSIWRKLERKGGGFDALFDVRAVRVLVEDIPMCYAVLGIIHGRWHPIPGQFDDYIANPKDNNYQSLHTAVIGPEGKTLEVQIRTQQMHEHAELGVAAHWRYKEGSQSDKALERRIQWLRQLLDSATDDTAGADIIDRFRTEIADERVYVITPRGQIIDLPHGATVLDFAYAIHTEIGHRCRGAKVNGQIVPLTRVLASGERVEILTSREAKPSRDWLIPQLGYITTDRARAKLRHWFKQLDYEENLKSGREILERELQRMGSDAKPEELAKIFDYAKTKVNDFLAAIGSGDISSAHIASRLQQPVTPSFHIRPAAPGKADKGIHVQGVGQLLTNIGRCCRPVPPDPIVGYITRGRGVTVHRRDCPSLLRLNQESPSRLINVGWGGVLQQTYTVTIRLEAYDRKGLLRDITGLLAEKQVNVLEANTHTDLNTGTAVMNLNIQIVDNPQLSHVLAALSRLPNVVSARRVK